jgi:hypothetical protein
MANGYGVIPGALKFGSDVGNIYEQSKKFEQRKTERAEDIAYRDKAWEENQKRYNEGIDFRNKQYKESLRQYKKTERRLDKKQGLEELEKGFAYSIDKEKTHRINATNFARVSRQAEQSGDMERADHFKNLSYKEAVEADKTGEKNANFYKEVENYIKGEGQPSGETQSIKSSETGYSPSAELTELGLQKEGEEEKRRRHEQGIPADLMTTRDAMVTRVKELRKDIQPQSKFWRSAFPMASRIIGGKSIGETERKAKEKEYIEAEKELADIEKEIKSYGGYPTKYTQKSRSEEGLMKEMGMRVLNRVQTLFGD